MALLLVVAGPWCLLGETDRLPEPLGPPVVLTQPHALVLAPAPPGMGWQAIALPVPQLTLVSPVAWAHVPPEHPMAVAYRARRAGLA